MTSTPETAGRVIRAWMAVEVLTPQGVKSDWGSFAADKGGRQWNVGGTDGPAQWTLPGDGDPTPWPLLEATAERLEVPPADAPAPAADEAEPRRWHVVVLAALPAQQALARLDAAFADAPDDDVANSRADGNILAATAVLDEWGVAVPDSLAIASFAWGLGQVLRDGAGAGLAGWSEAEGGLKQRFGGNLAPTGAEGLPRSLTWHDLRAVSLGMAEEMGLPPELWQVAPCAIEVVSKDPPRPDLLSSFLLRDLARVLVALADGGDGLSAAAQSYLGLCPPGQAWDALDRANRPRLAELLRPGRFPLGRWPGPGLHPLTLLQQAAVNAVVGDLGQGDAPCGLAAINGPPGTGKTTLLRDLVAHVMVSRAERLAGLDDPRGDLSGLDLMDFAVVVASSNNAAVENISLELPVAAKALDPSIWQGGARRDGGLEYFSRTADAVLGLDPEGAGQEGRAWGLMAARLGSAANRRAFFGKFWFDEDWGLRRWLDIAAFPDWQREPPSKLAERDPPPRWPEAMAGWRAARDAFRQALARCADLRRGLEALDDAGTWLRDIEAAMPEAQRRLDGAARDLDSAVRAAAAARAAAVAEAGQEAVEGGKLAALASVAPSWLARLFRTRAWTAHVAEVRAQVARLGSAQDARRAAEAQVVVAVAEAERLAAGHAAALQARDGLAHEAARLAALLGQADADGSLPGPGFWSQPDDVLLREAPWNGGAFRAARDAVFVAAVRLHRAFVVAAARTLKGSLNAVAGGGGRAATAADWGAFFLVVPVASTTFASMGRMFARFGAGEIGWLLIDEAGQATPQAALGAIWRARRAVVIGDPLQIEPVAATPQRTTRLIFEANGADPACWAAPGQSAQTLADRASVIQGRFPIQGDAGREGAGERVTGIPLLVHRRCEEPMFGIANAIAYAGRMVAATEAGPSPIRDVLGVSAWIDVDAPSLDKWVEAEGALIAAAIARLAAVGGAVAALPDLYVICPFKLPALRLRTLLERTPGVLAGHKAAVRREWIKARVGTVHTCQGKEAEAVILMLGAGRGARAGSRAWAGGTPNLLNVAATRARRALYVVGNRGEWQAAGVFAHAARVLPVRSGREWLGGVQAAAE